MQSRNSASKQHSFREKADLFYNWHILLVDELQDKLPLERRCYLSERYRRRLKYQFMALYCVTGDEIWMAGGSRGGSATVYIVDLWYSHTLSKQTVQ